MKLFGGFSETLESEIKKRIRKEMSRKKLNQQDEEKNLLGTVASLQKAEKKNDIIQVLLNAQSHSNASEIESLKTKGKVLF